MLNAKKYSNLALQTASFVASRFFKINSVWAYPYSAGIELTNNCNLACKHCPSGSGISTREKGYMSPELFEKIRSEFSGYILKTLFYFQGESMMHPRFFEFLKDAGEMGAIISTNGHFLDSQACHLLGELNFDKIIVSLDGLSEKSYQSYRKGGKLEKVLEGIELLSKELYSAKKADKMIIQVLVNRYNENELAEIKAFGRRLGVKVGFKSMQLLEEVGGEDFLPTDNSYRRYKLNSGKLSIRSRQPDYCYRLWTTPVITWDGKVLPCCFDKDAEYVMGDLNKQTFREIWSGDPYKDFRSRLLKMRADINICNNCTEGLDRRVKI